MPYDYPDDLLRQHREFDQAATDLTALLNELPHRAQRQPEPYVDGLGQPREPHEGWTNEDRERVGVLRDRQRALAVQMSDHPYWQTLTGGDRTAARLELRKKPAAG